ncbi:MAG: class I SAM-dependent methyltransferase [Candidatus Bathyarchaeota archaeon]|nr:class I SAM-dependent methyltransferase [Candidatus Termiticorpusculum sp.]
MKDTKDMKFDKMAATYDEGIEGKASKKFYNLLLKQIGSCQDVTILDVGCGTGTILKSLSDRTNINGYGIDTEENMIQEAKKKCPDMDLSVSDCVKTPFADNQFDIVTSCMAYHHFADKKGFAKEVSRIIKPGGHLYITDPRFPWIVRKPLNLAIRIHKITGYFGTPKEIEKVFLEYGFELVDCSFDLYAQCVKLRKNS